MCKLIFTAFIFGRVREWVKRNETRSQNKLDRLDRGIDGYSEELHKWEGE